MMWSMIATFTFMGVSALVGFAVGYEKGYELCEKGEQQFNEFWKEIEQHGVTSYPVVRISSSKS